MEVKSLGRGLMSLLLAADCKICQQVLEPFNRSFICRNCWSEIRWLRAPYCSKCSKPFPSSLTFQDISSILCPECRTEHSYFEKVFTPTLYEGIMKEAIHLFKYNKKMGILRLVREILNSYFDHADFPSFRLDLVIPIPLHRKKMRERGFNQAELIANTVARRFQIRLIKGNLQRVKATASQTALSKKARRKNVKESFKVKNKHQFYAKRILLVDDVYTTGATIKEAAKVLKKAGAKKIYALTLARAP